MRPQEKDGDETYRLTVEPIPNTEMPEKTTNRAAGRTDSPTEKAALKGPSEAKTEPKTAATPTDMGATEKPTLKEIILEQATEDEAPLNPSRTLRKILGGDILNTSTIRRQIWLFMLITLFLFVYISNRYSCQKHLIEIDQLTKELQDVKYKSLSSNSQFTEKSRESNVLRLLRNNKDTTLRMADQPPYMVNVPEE
jgi:hypothetical protein